MKRVFTQTWIFIMFFSGTCFSQDMFQKYYSNISYNYPLLGRGAFQTLDHGFILIAEQLGSLSIDQGVCLIRTDSVGHAMWSRVYSGSTEYGASMIRQTVDSGFIFTGESKGFNAIWNQVFAHRTDKNGVTLWTRFYNDSSNCESKDLCLTPDNGFMLLGNFISADVFIVKADLLGNSEFSYQYSTSGNVIKGNSIKATRDGGYVIAGDITSNVIAAKDIFLMKIDSAGQVAWCKKFGGIGEEHSYCIQETSDGGFILAGSTNSYGTGDFDIVVMKTNDSGNLQWVKSYGGVSLDYAHYIQETKDHGFAISATTYSFPIIGINTYLLKTDSVGTLSWSKTLGGVQPVTVDQTNDGGYAVCGHYGQTGRCYLVKTDSLGNTECNNYSPLTIETVGTFADTNLTITMTSVGIQINNSFNLTVLSPLEDECFINSTDDSYVADIISFSPNPIRSDQIITFSKELIMADIIITDLLGNIVFEKIMKGKELCVETAHLKTGLYLMNVKSERISFQNKLIIL